MLAPGILKGANPTAKLRFRRRIALAILGGESVAGVLARLLEGTRLAKVLDVVAQEEDDDDE